MNTNDRRRLTLAFAFTALALPALWVFDSGGASGDRTVDAVSLGGRGSDTAPPTTEYQPETPMFIGGDAEPAEPGVVDVAVPPAPGDNDHLVKASFSRFVGASRPLCTAVFAPDGVSLTVVNIDNGQSVVCTNTYGMNVPAGADIVLDTDLYTQIGALADAPIPVRVTW